MDKLKLRGIEYKVKSVVGDLELQTLFAYTEAKDLDDPAQKKKTAQTLKNLIEDCPDDLITNDGQILLWHDEYLAILEFFRLKYCRDNLAEAKRQGRFDQERRFAAIQARILAMAERDKATTITYDDDGLPETSSVPKITEADKFKHHRAYYDQELESCTDPVRRQQLEQALIEIIAKFQEKTGQTKGNLPSALPVESLSTEELEKMLEQRKTKAD